jgi:hypothetical protein
MGNLCCLGSDLQESRVEDDMTDLIKIEISSIQDFDECGTRNNEIHSDLINISSESALY